MREVGLNGAWKLHTERFGETAANVPGCLHTDLLKAGKIENPLIRDNANKCRELEFESPVYSKSFIFKEMADSVYLEFSMLDVYCDVFLNGCRLGFCDDMFIPHHFDVSKIIRYGENYIEVRFYPPAEYVKNKPKRFAVFTAERLYTRRMQCTYFWDWVDRFVTMGICGDVKLLLLSETEIENVFAETLDADPECAQVRIDTDFANIGGESYLHICIQNPQGETVYTHRQLIVEKHSTRIADIEKPQLWFPNGYGEQPLYKAIIYAADSNGTELSRKELKFGVRHVKAVQLCDRENDAYFVKCRELQQCEHLKGKDNNDTFSGFTVTVNGIPVMCKGADWVPSEPFVSDETDEKITRILELAKLAGMNIVRIWGGGIFEREHFYCECDRLGLMVCQDFLMACGDYPQDDAEFCENIRREAEFITKKLRNHASFIMWIGDNENAADCDDDIAPYPGRHVVRDVIWSVVKKNDPNRIFLTSSPYGGKPYMCATSGTTHNTSYLKDIFNEIMKTDLANPRNRLEDYISRFSTEEPTLGAPQKSSVMKFMTKDDFYDESEAMWRFHTKNNTSCFTEYEIYDCMRTAAQKLYGSFKNADDKLIKMQYLQYQWVSATLELHRRNKGFSSGVSYWMLNDCWPAFGWALIDYYALPKAGWYGFKHSAMPVKASFDANGNIYICNDSLNVAEGRLVLYRVTENGCETVTETAFRQAANTSSEFLRNETVIKDSVYVCDIKTSDGADRAVWYPNRLADTGIKSGSVEILSKTEESITLIAHGYVPAVMLDGESCVFEDNCFAMLDGEIRTVGITGNQCAEISVGII